MNLPPSAAKIRSPSGCVTCRDERAKDVIRAAARRANWKPEKQPGIGHGIGFARYKNTGAYCAVVAEVEGAEDIRVRRLTIAVDVGEAINPDGVINQIEGGAIQATSWVLKERVRFDRQRITSTSWAEYPILRFSEVPDVEVEVIQRPDMRPARRRRSRARPGHGRHRQRRVRCARGARARSADHARQPDRRDGIDLMSSLEHSQRRRGAGPGRKPGSRLSRRRPDFDIAGEFGAVGAMADKLRKGTPADIVILTAALVAKLAEEKLVVAASIADVGLVETALAVRAGDPPAHGQRCRRPARRVARGGRDLRSGYQDIDGRNSRCRKSCSSLASPTRSPPGSGSFRTARPRCANWRRPDAASADRLHAIDRNHQHQGRELSGSLPPGCELADHVYGGGDHAGRCAAQARTLIDLLTDADTRELRLEAGFLDAPHQ